MSELTDVLAELHEGSKRLVELKHEWYENYKKLTGSDDPRTFEQVCDDALGEEWRETYDSLRPGL